MDGTLAAWWRRWRYTDAYNVLSALVVTGVVLGGAYGEAHPQQFSDRLPAGSAAAHTPGTAFLLVAVACLALAVRRRYPVPVLAVSTAAVMAYSLPGYENGSALMAPAIALYLVAETRPLVPAILAGTVVFAALASATLPGNPFGPTGGAFILLPALVVVPLLAGVAVRSRNAYASSVEDRAAADASRRVDEERLRIARELHDIVAHSMATISVQAGVAEHVLGENPAAASDALRAIKIASRDGLRELRAILNVLRQADEGDPTQPAPSLSQLGALVSRASQAGLPTTIRQAGQPRPLPAGLDLAAYRIIQESLTNAIRHAGPATATVAVSYHDAELQIVISDTGRPAAGLTAPGSGHGLIGMRERAASAGGTLTAGPVPDGGYRVTAVLPLDSRPGPDLAGRAGAASAELEPGGRAAVEPASGISPADDTAASRP
jgi:signal transduction histidine kinase